MQAALFWVLWSADLLLAILVGMAMAFRGEMNASTGLQAGLLLVLAAALAGSLAARYAFRQPLLGLLLVCLPPALLLLWRIWDLLHGESSGTG
ncbi:MAG: hypothetical protein NW241_18860 [Bacteroidia bacterium]|nr:hypothetical protein [Bacteroidia bacterium]